MNDEGTQFLLILWYCFFFLYPAHTFVNNSFFILSSNYSVWMCHVFPAWPLTGLFSKLKYSKRACERTSRSILHIWWLAGSNLEFCFCSFSHTAGKIELIFYFYFFIFAWTWKIIGFQPSSWIMNGLLLFSSCPESL